MDKAGKSLSKACVKALIQSGEVFTPKSTAASATSRPVIPAKAGIQ